MLANLIKYQEIDAKLNAIETQINQSEEKKQAFVAYKYVAKSFKFMMFGRVKKIYNLLRGVINEF